MVEPTTTAVSLLAIERGLEIGAFGFKEARKLFRETWSRAFPDYDLEKVFWRTIYAEGLWFLASFVYGNWLQVRLLATHPEIVTEELITGIKVQAATNWGFPLYGAGAVAQYIVDAILKNIFGTARVEEVEEERRAEFEKKKREAIEGLGVPMFLHDLFTKYNYHVMLGIPVFFGLLEYRQYKLRKQLHEALAIL